MDDVFEGHAFLDLLLGLGKIQQFAAETQNEAPGILGIGKGQGGGATAQVDTAVQDIPGLAGVEQGAIEKVGGHGRVDIAAPGKRHQAAVSTTGCQFFAIGLFDLEGSTGIVFTTALHTVLGRTFHPADAA